MSYVYEIRSLYMPVSRDRASCVLARRGRLPAGRVGGRRTLRKNGGWVSSGGRKQLLRRLRTRIVPNIILFTIARGIIVHILYVMYVYNNILFILYYTHGIESRMYKLYIYVYYSPAHFAVQYKKLSVQCCEIWKCDSEMLFIAQSTLTVMMRRMRMYMLGNKWNRFVLRGKM